MQKMEYKWIVPFTILAFILVLVNCDNPYYRPRYVPKPCTLCNTHRGQCCMLMKEGEGIRICCNGTVAQNFHPTQFATMRNRSAFPTHYKPSPWSIKFWTYNSFITAAAKYEPYGFGTTYKDGGQVFLGTMEIAALLAHVGSKVTCDDQENGGRYIIPVNCGLCNYKEKNTNITYCDERYKDYPCAPGVAYYGRGALPIYWNYNYGEATKDLNVDLLNHPDYIQKNDTLAFLVAIWRWMTPIKNQPSAHDVFIGNWKPTENDKFAKRVSGFGTTMNVLYGDLVCGKGSNETSMNNIIDYYQHYLDLIGVNSSNAGPRELLSCANQVPFNLSVAQSP